MKRKILLVTLVASIILLSFPGCLLDFGFSFNLSDYRYRFDEYFQADLDGATRVKITIYNGPISVTTWDNDSVEITVDERVKARNEEDAEELAQEIKLVSYRKGNELEIELDFGDRYSRRRYYYSGLEVRLPKHVELELLTTNGHLQIGAMENDVFARTTNGHIDLEATSGNARLETTNGKIVTGLVDGELIASSTNGSLSLEVLEGPLRGGTTNGSITAIISDTLRDDVRLSSTNGGIELFISEESSFELEARTTNGRVLEDLGREFEGDFNRKKTRLNGKNLDGEYLVRLSTTNGRIEINSR